MSKDCDDRVRFLYVGDKSHACITVAYRESMRAEGENYGWLQVGFAFLRDGDHFCKKRARQIAEGRLRKYFKSLRYGGDPRKYIMGYLATSAEPFPNTRHYRALSEELRQRQEQQ